MKKKVRLGCFVELVVEGKTEEEIQEWLNCTTPEEAKALVKTSTGNYVTEDYSEEILYSVAESTNVDYVISRSLTSVMEEAGRGDLVCTSFEEAKNNNRTRNIVIIDDADIYFTYKRDGEFGEILCWTEDEFKEDPNVYTFAANFAKSMYDTDEKVERLLNADGCNPYPQLFFAPYDKEMERED